MRFLCIDIKRVPNNQSQSLYQVDIKSYLCTALLTVSLIQNTHLLRFVLGGIINNKYYPLVVSYFSLISCVLPLRAATVSYQLDNGINCQKLVRLMLFLSQNKETKKTTEISRSCRKRWTNILMENECYKNTIWEKEKHSLRLYNEIYSQQWSPSRTGINLLQRKCSLCLLCEAFYINKKPQ